MKKNILWILWSGAYVLCAALGFLPERSSGLQAFLEEMDMPATLANMAAAREFFSDSIKKYDLWQEEDSEEVLEHFDDPDALDQTYEKLEEKQIPEDIDYNKVSNLASEARQKLAKVRPISLGQAARISGVNPSDLSILSIYLKKEYSKND